MYGLPGQDLAGAVRDIEEALALSPAHLSHYQLTIEPGTVFAARPPVLPGEEDIDDMLSACQERLNRHGFTRYEVSAYARSESRCRHNLNYWTFGDYLGVVACAHGKLTFAASGLIVRTRQPRDPRRYLAASQPLTRWCVPREELPFEFMLNALRLTHGFEIDTFAARTGLEWSELPAVAELVTRGLLEVHGRRCRPTPLGLRFLNDALVAFMPKNAGVRALSTGN